MTLCRPTPSSRVWGIIWMVPKKSTWKIVVWRRSRMNEWKVLFLFSLSFSMEEKRKLEYSEKLSTQIAKRQIQIRVGLWPKQYNILRMNSVLCNINGLHIKQECTGSQTVRNMTKKFLHEPRMNKMLTFVRCFVGSHLYFLIEHVGLKFRLLPV